jgi:hypothetical protein
MMYEELEADERRDAYHEWLDEQPKCRQCGTLWDEKSGIYDEEYDRYFCDQSCVENFEQDQAEAANERYLESFYGGDRPVTERERHVQAWQQKRG